MYYRHPLQWWSRRNKSMKKYDLWYGRCDSYAIYDIWYRSIYHIFSIIWSRRNKNSSSIILKYIITKRFRNLSLSFSQNGSNTVLVKYRVKKIRTHNSNFLIRFNAVTWSIAAGCFSFHSPSFRICNFPKTTIISSGYAHFINTTPDVVGSGPTLEVMKARWRRNPGRKTGYKWLALTIAFVQFLITRWPRPWCHIAAQVSDDSRSWYCE